MLNELHHNTDRSLLLLKFTPKYLALMQFGWWVFTHVTLLSLIGAAAVAADVDGESCVFDNSVILFICSHLFMFAIRLSAIRYWIFYSLFVRLFYFMWVFCPALAPFTWITFVKVVRVHVHVCLYLDSFFFFFRFAITTYAKMQSIG